MSSLPFYPDAPSGATSDVATAKAEKVVNGIMERYEPGANMFGSDENMELPQIDAGRGVAGVRMAAVASPRGIARWRPTQSRVLYWIKDALQDIPDEEWLIQDLAPAVGTGVFHGEAGCKKTWTLLNLAAHVAAGYDWMGRTVKQGPVLIIDEESGDGRLRRRMARVLRGAEVPFDAPIAYTTMNGFMPALEADRGEIDELMGVVKPVLVVVDSLVDVICGDENSAVDMSMLFRSLRYLAEKHQCFVAVIHHDSKKGDYRGSTAIPGSVDLRIQVESKITSPNIDFTVKKVRDSAPQGTFAATACWIDLPEPKFTLTLAGAHKAMPFSNSPAGKYVLAYLKKHGPTLLEDIKNHADACTPNAARKAVYALVGEGFVQRVKDDRKEATYELVSIPFIQ